MGKPRDFETNDQPRQNEAEFGPRKGIFLERKTLGGITVFLTVPGSKDQSILTIGKEEFGTHIYI
jgi:hypothetical protein